MAVQANGITVVRVNTATHRIQFYVGSVEVVLRYRHGHRRFSEVCRSYIDGRRAAERPFIPDAQWRDMIRQAHGIAVSRGWKT